jgi:RecG-like helicase
MAYTFTTPLTHVKGVGHQTAQALARLGMHTVGDALATIPTRYSDRSAQCSIAELTPNIDLFGRL